MKQFLKDNWAFLVFATLLTILGLLKVSASHAIERQAGINEAATYQAPLR